MKPVCVPCQRFFRVEKVGHYFLEGMPKVNDAKAGTSEPEKWQPYKLWVGDLWVCEGCGARILSGFGRERIAEHYEPDFKEKIDRYSAKLQVNDC